MTEVTWVAPYKDILAVADEESCRVELVEETSCFGGAQWARLHFERTSPLIESSRIYGNTFRYLLAVGTSELVLKPTHASAGIESICVEGERVEVTYKGIGGGGVGVTACRAGAEDVLDYRLSEFGGSKTSEGVIVLPRRKRVIIGVDDTDSRDEGATWSLVHNIASSLNSREWRYLSHSIVQLFPVKIKTQNCVSTVVEFACMKNENKLISGFKELLEDNTLSDETGMAVLSRFSADYLDPFGSLCKTEEVTLEAALAEAEEAGARVEMGGLGAIGAVASLPYFCSPENSVVL